MLAVSESYEIEMAVATITKLIIFFNGGTRHPMGKCNFYWLQNKSKQTKIQLHALSPGNQTKPHKTSTYSFYMLSSSPNSPQKKKKKEKKNNNLLSCLPQYLVGKKKKW